MCCRLFCPVSRLSPFTEGDINKEYSGPDFTNTEYLWTLVTLEVTAHVLPQLITVVPEVSRIYSLSMDEMVFQQFTMPSEGNDWRLTLVIWPMIISGAKLKHIGTLAPTTTHNMVDGILGEATKWAIIRCICQPTLQAM